MTQSEYLQQFDLLLTVRSPLCVGSGFSYQKNEYLFDFRTKRVSILDQDRFVDLLFRKGLADAYERFILEGGKLYDFLHRECRLSAEEINGVTRYSLNAAEALSESRSLRAIQAFQRDAYGRAYIPGSSVKGALRTAYLVHCILKSQGTAQRDFQESDFMNLLKCGEKQENAVNDMFRGIRISDSAPIRNEAMILAGKIDVMTNGATNGINVCRECIRPGETISVRLTLDQSVLKQQITKETLEQSIAEFSKYYGKFCSRHFKRPYGDSGEIYQNCLVFGAGAGFFSKTVVYPYYGEEEGLRRTAQFMQKRFKQGNHEKDIALGVSPHTMKYTEYGGQRYPFGVCGVKIQ